MAIEFKPKKEKKERSLVNIVFYISLIVFLIFLATYLLFFYLQKETKKEISFTKEAQKRTSSEAALEDLVLGYQKKIDYFSHLLKEHNYITHLFDFLEKNTHPNVSFTDFQLNLKNNTLFISGTTDNFENLGQQVNIFRKQNFVKDLKIEKVSTGKEGGVIFSLFFTFDNQIFK